MKAKPNVEARLKSESEDIEKRQLELKKELDDLQKRQSKLSEEMTILNQDIARVRLQTQPRPNRILNSIQKSWRRSKPVFMIEVLLILTVIATLIAFAYRNVRLEYLFVVLGLSMVVIVALYYRNHKLLMVNFMMSSVLFAISLYVTDQSFRWNITFAALGVLTLGFALHSFNFGERVENQLREIDKKVTKLTKSPDPQVKETKKKPQADE